MRAGEQYEVGGSFVAAHKWDCVLCGGLIVKGQLVTFVRRLGLVWSRPACGNCRAALKIEGAKDARASGWRRAVWEGGRS